MRVSKECKLSHRIFPISGKNPPNAPNFDCVLLYPQRQEETAIEGAVRRSVETGDRGRGSDTRAAINRRTVCELSGEQSRVETSPAKARKSLEFIISSIIGRL